MGLILLIVAIILTVLLLVPSIIFAIFRTVGKFEFNSGRKKLNEYFLKMAICIDQLGNVMAAPLLNLTCLKKKGHRFGETRETISLVLGYNSRLNNLTVFGESLGWLLNKIDNNHLEKAIEAHEKYWFKMVNY